MADTTILVAEISDELARFPPNTPHHYLPADGSLKDSGSEQLK